MTKNNDIMFQKAALNTNRKNVYAQISVNVPKESFRQKCFQWANELNAQFFGIALIFVIALAFCALFLDIGSIVSKNQLLDYITVITFIAASLIFLFLIFISQPILIQVRQHKVKVKILYNNYGFSKKSLRDVDTTNFTESELCQLVEHSLALIKAYQKANGKTELLPKEWQWFNKKNYLLKNGLQNVDKSNKCYDIIKNEYVIGKIVVNRENHYINHFEVLTISKDDLVLANEHKNSLLDTYYTELAKLYSENNIENKNKNMIELVINYFRKSKGVSNNNQYHNNHRHLTYIRRENVLWQK